MRRKRNFRSKGVENPGIYSNATEVFSFRRLISSAVNAVRLIRSSDLAETDVLLPYNYGEFISLDSEVSEGITLGEWVGTNHSIIKKIYGQKGNNDLDKTSAELRLVDNGGLNTFNGRPTVKIASQPQGLVAAGMNGGLSITNAHIFGAYYNWSTATTSRAFGFGNYSADGLGSQKRHWNVAGDNTLRFDGAAITSNLIAAATGSKQRTAIKVGDTYSDYINGTENIAPTELLGTNIVDDFYIGPHEHSALWFSEAIVYLTDTVSNKDEIIADQKAAYTIS